MIENWSGIEGELRSWRPSSDVPGFGVAEVHVDRVEPVSPFPNLLEDAGGRTLRVLVPLDSAQELETATGARIAVRVRRAGPARIYAHPDHVTVK
jgi:hypothetical protein